jgi:hypothetical protein
MSTMQEQVVSKIREATKGLPAMQKRVLADAKAKGSSWMTIDRIPAVYCVFRRSVCLYVGQTSDVARQIKVNHPIARLANTSVHYFPLIGSTVLTRRSATGKCPNQLCQPARWNEPKRKVA